MCLLWEPSTWRHCLGGVSDVVVQSKQLLSRGRAVAQSPTKICVAVADVWENRGALAVCLRILLGKWAGSYQRVGVVRQADRQGMYLRRIGLCPHCFISFISFSNRRWRQR